MREGLAASRVAPRRAGARLSRAFGSESFTHYSRYTTYLNKQRSEEQDLIKLKPWRQRFQMLVRAFLTRQPIH